MAADRPYKVKNLRARKTLSLFGTLLAPQASKGHGTTFLTEAEFNSTHVQTLIKMGRLTVLESPKPEEAAAAPSAPIAPPVVEPPAPEPPAPEPPALEPESEPPAPEPAEPPQEPASEEPEVQAPSLDDITFTWSEDELFALNTADQKTILRSRDLKVGGKEADRVQRILDNQGN